MVYGEYQEIRPKGRRVTHNPCRPSNFIDVMGNNVLTVHPLGVVPKGVLENVADKKALPTHVGISAWVREQRGLYRPPTPNPKDDPYTDIDNLVRVYGDLAKAAREMDRAVAHREEQVHHMRQLVDVARGKHPSSASAVQTTFVVPRRNDAVYRRPFTGSVQMVAHRQDSLKLFGDENGVPAEVPATRGLRFLRRTAHVLVTADRLRSAAAKPLRETIDQHGGVIPVM